jgi:acetyltransferase-like isoleucine patch superfamily enzyme
VRLEDGVLVGPDVCFSNDPRPRSGVHFDSYPKTTVRTGASLGAGAILVPSVTIGRFAMVGAGSLVTRDVPDYALAYGSPARRHGSVCRCGKTLRFEDRRAACACGRAYELSGDDAVSES